jgi:predicted transcriptional regulator
MTGLLFDMPVTPNPPEERGPLSHRGDPETSREAAEQLRKSGRLAAQQRAVLEALRECDGATHAELGRFMERDWLVAARRLPELERMGLVRKGEVRRCAVKGSRCVTWWLAEGGDLGERPNVGE